MTTTDGEPAVTRAGPRKKESVAHLAELLNHLDLVLFQPALLRSGR